MTFTLEAPCAYPVPNNVCTDLLNRVILGHRTPYKAEVSLHSPPGGGPGGSGSPIHTYRVTLKICLERDNSAGTCVLGPLNVLRSLPEASSTHSATAQQSPQGSSMKGLCAVVGIGTTAVLHSVL